MCAPILGAVVGLAGSAVSAIGAMQQANAQAQMDEYNAKVAKINARSRRYEGMKEQEQIGDKYDRLQGQQTAAIAKGGIDPMFGSALAIFGETEQERLQDQNTAYIKAESQATGEENKAKAYELSAQNHRKAGKIAAAGTFLSGLSGAIGKFGNSGVGSPLLINS